MRPTKRVNIKIDGGTLLERMMVAFYLIAYTPHKFDNMDAHKNYEIIVTLDAYEPYPDEYPEDYVKKNIGFVNVLAEGSSLKVTMI